MWGLHGSPFSVLGKLVRYLNGNMVHHCNFARARTRKLSLSTIELAQHTAASAIGTVTLLLPASAHQGKVAIHRRTQCAMAGPTLQPLQDMPRVSLNYFLSFLLSISMTKRIRKVLLSIPQLATLILEGMPPKRNS